MTLSAGTGQTAWDSADLCHYPPSPGDHLARSPDLHRRTGNGAGWPCGQVQGGAVTQASDVHRKRTRLSPEARREQILDEAAQRILAEGLTSVSMERLARSVGISKGLVYNYFPTRNALLTALLSREQAELRRRGMASALRAESFADLIRQTTRLYLEQTRDRGALIAALMSDPSVAGLMEEDNRADRERTVRYFVRETRRQYDLPLPVAIAAVEMVSAITDRAGQLVADGTLDVEAATEMCVGLITGGLAGLRARRRA